MAMANAAADACVVPPMRPTTRSPSLTRKTSVPSVVLRPELDEATASENAFDPFSWSAPNELLLALTTAVALCAKRSSGFGAGRSVLGLTTEANGVAAAGLSSAWMPADSSCATLVPVNAIAAVGPSSRNWILAPIPVELVALSPSPSVTVTTASNALSVIAATSLASPLVSGVPCFSEAYCAVLTTPVKLLMAMANAAANVGSVPPMRPTTRSPSLTRKTSVPSVVLRPELDEATASENTFDPFSWSAPNELPAEVTTALALCAKRSSGFGAGRSVLGLTTEANGVAAAGLSSAWRPADSSCATLVPVNPISAAGPSSRNWIWAPIPVELVALSPSPSVTVTTASTALSVIDATSLASPLVSGVPCFSEAYCAVLTTPVKLLMAMANAAANVGSVPPMRPTTRSPSLTRKTSVPSVVLRPELDEATASENTFDPFSWSAPNELPAEVTTALALCAKRSSGFGAGRSVLGLTTEANGVAAAGLSSAWRPADSSCATLVPVNPISAAGPSSRNWIWAPIPVELVALSPSPSVTVTTASTALSVIDATSLASPLVSGVPCFSEAYCAVLTTPVKLLMAMANAAANVGSVPPMRPTTRSPSLTRKTSVPSVVLRPELDEATASENTFDPFSWSAPNELPAEVTTALALCAKRSSGFGAGRSVLGLTTEANGVAAAGLSSAWRPADSSCATL